MKDWLNDTTYKDVIIQGSKFTGKPYESRNVVLNQTMKDEYLPALNNVQASKGLKLLATAMAHMEGFAKGNKNYITHNPGNIGNTDSGATHILGSLEDGIRLQIQFLTDVANGKKKNYPIGKEVKIPSFYSEEIAKHTQTYQKSPWVPGYHFTFTGQLDQFIKIYATGARSGNTYLNTITSYFQQNGIIITPETTIQEIINIK